jgi:hypothetical protein
MVMNSPVSFGDPSGTLLEVVVGSFDRRSA